MHGKHGENRKKPVYTKLLKSVCLIFVILSVGCGGLSKPILLKLPDVPMVVTEDVRVNVSIENPPESGEFINFGWTTIPKGMTIIWYDWKEMP
jgi:hypothetical protein